MTFKQGCSGNPHGRPRGALSKRTQLSKLLEPRSVELVEKMIELALDGDAQALRLIEQHFFCKFSLASSFTG